MLKRIYFLLAFLLIGSTSPSGQTPAADVALVLPFENVSGKQEFNWVGESFADSLSDLLRMPALNVVSNEERKIIQQRLRIPLNNIPSLATSLKLAQVSNATMLISGRYNIVPASADTAATVVLNAKVVRVNEGRFLSERLPDGSIQIPPLELTDALGNLQTMQAQLAFKILFLQFKNALTVSQNDLIVAANKVPAKAFEAYIKGLLTPAGEARVNYFKNAMRLYSEAAPESIYLEPSLELGHLYRDQRKYTDAIAAFERVVSATSKCREEARSASRRPNCSDEKFAEASFYIGLIYWQQGNLESALATLRPLTEDLNLISVYSSLGAIAVQASRAEKKNEAKSAALLTEGTELLKRAADSAPDDANVRFNYALALFLMGNHSEAAQQFRSAIIGNQRDGEAYYVLSKTLEALKDPTAADINNQAQRFLTDGNRYAKLETEWQRAKTLADIQLRVNQPARRDFVAVVLSRRPATAPPVQVSETEALLALARTLIKNGNDDEALTALRRILASEPMSAESYLMLGKIHLRRGDLDQAISSFKTSVFWDNRLIDAHISLGKIYVEKGDCLQAKSYVASALEINAENADAMALQRMSERCSK